MLTILIFPLGLGSQDNRLAWREDILQAHCDRHSLTALRGRHLRSRGDLKRLGSALGSENEYY